MTDTGREKTPEEEPHQEQIARLENEKAMLGRAIRYAMHHLDVDRQSRQRDEKSLRVSLRLRSTLQHVNIDPDEDA